MKIAHLLSVAAMATLVTAQAEAADLRARAGVGFLAYTLSPNWVDYDANAGIMAGSVGVTAGFDRSYLDFLYQFTLSGEHNLYDDAGYGMQPIDRTDWTLTYGYSLSQKLTVFAGWKSGETVLDAPSGFLWTKDTFKASGPFAGAATAFGQTDNGSFSANAALGLMAGNWSDDSGFFDNDADNTVGFSIGGAYNRYIGEAGTLSLGVAFQNYHFDFGEGNTADEAITNFSATYSQAF